MKQEEEKTVKNSEPRFKKILGKFRDLKRTIKHQGIAINSLRGRYENETRKNNELQFKLDRLSSGKVINFGWNDYIELSIRVDKNILRYGEHEIVFENAIRQLIEGIEKEIR